MSIELLQEIGLNKYEAEAYYTLLRQGPLTGYELGKRSQVPLSRSYDVLERLSQKGLALAQPGDPTRYKALEPELFLGNVRSNMESTLTTLASALIAEQHTQREHEFWVIRGHEHMLARTRTLCAQARQSIALALPETYSQEMASSLLQARQRGCETSLTTSRGTASTHIFLLVDRHEALLGTLEAGESSQAIVSTNPALIIALASFFAADQHRALPAWEEQYPAVSSPAQNDWLEWEKRKQQRLRNDQTGQRIA